MFIFKLGSPESRGNHSQLPSADSKTLKSMNCATSLSSKLVPVAFMFPSLMPDLNRKYRNVIEIDKN